MAEAKTTGVSFACQRCLQALRLDESFGHMSEYAIAELDLPIIFPHKEVDLHDPRTTGLTHFVPPFRLTDTSTNGNNGFMMVTDGRDAHHTLSTALKARADLFDALSSNSEIDHPLCDECTDSLVELMDEQLTIGDRERAEYSSYLKKLEQQKEVPDVDKLQKELDELNAEQERLISELDKLKADEDKVQENIRLKKEERARLDGEEEKFRREYTKYRRELILTEDQMRSLDTQLSYTEGQMGKLSKTNVFNMTFHIWHQGHFGTINTFRMGRLPASPVDWSEINAAWGQTALLLTALARKVNLTFRRYRVVPFGNHSYVEVLGEDKELPLYGTGGFKFFWDTKFDAAMVAFLDCLNQFKEQVEKSDAEFCFPYRMDKGKIEDSSNGNSYSIKIQFNSEEQWTKALKFLLTNLKWGLAWVSAQFKEDDMRKQATASK